MLVGPRLARRQFCKRQGHVTGSGDRGGQSEGDVRLGMKGWMGKRRMEAITRLMKREENIWITWVLCVHSYICRKGGRLIWNENNPRWWCKFGTKERCFQLLFSPEIPRWLARFPYVPVDTLELAYMMVMMMIMIIMINIIIFICIQQVAGYWYNILLIMR